MQRTKSTELFIRIAVLENIIEAQIVESVLKDQGIPHRVRSFHDTAYDGLFQLQKGWGEIYAPLSRQEDIQDILKDIRAQEE